MTRLLQIVMTLAVVLLPCVSPGQTQTPVTFRPVPCPEQAWTYVDPSFTALPGARSFAGRYDGGLYQIEVPDNWNGELVLFAHGAVRNSGPTGSQLRVHPPPLRRHLIDRGLAWAASSYRCNGSVNGIGLVDTMALSAEFARVYPVRAPSKTYLVGGSLGGRAVLLGIRFFPERFEGALAMCPVGQETNDWRAAISAAAEAITGVRIDAANIDASMARVEQAVGSIGNLTDKGRQLASLTIESSGGPRPFAVEGLASRLVANVRDGASMTPDYIVRAATTRGFEYRLDSAFGLTAAELTARVRVKEPEGNLRSSAGGYQELWPFDGHLSRPVMTLAGTGDLQVPVYQQRALRQAAEKAGRGDMLVQRLMRIPAHCQFSEQEERQAFDDLVAWVRTGSRPQGDDVMGDLRDAGRQFTNPLRPGDPGAVRVVR